MEQVVVERERGHVLDCQWNVLLCWGWEEPSSQGICQVILGSSGAPHCFMAVKHWFVLRLSEQLGLITQVPQGTIDLLKKGFKINRWAQKKIGPNYLGVLFPYHSIAWVRQLHVHCVWFIFACAAGSEALRSSTKYNKVQRFWDTKTCNDDFYFNVIMVARVLAGWMTQESAKPLERELESCLAQRSTVGAACHAVSCLDQAWDQIILSALLRFSLEKSLHWCQVFLPEWAAFLLCCWWGIWDWNKKLLKHSVATLVLWRVST